MNPNFSFYIDRPTGTLRLTRPAWTSIKVPAHSISPQGMSGAPKVDNETGLFLFRGNLDNGVSLLVPMESNWKEGSPVFPYVAWAKTSDEEGSVKWEIRYKRVEALSPLGPWSDPVEGVPPVGPGATQNVTPSGFGAIDMSGKHVGTGLLFQLVRKATEDTYAKDACMFGVGVQILIDSIGSGKLTVK